MGLPRKLICKLSFGKCSIANRTMTYHGRSLDLWFDIRREMYHLTALEKLIAAPKERCVTQRIVGEIWGQKYKIFPCCRITPKEKQHNCSNTTRRSDLFGSWNQDKHTLLIFLLPHWNIRRANDQLQLLQNIWPPTAILRPAKLGSNPSIYLRGGDKSHY
jgi:hypothetical protein